MYINRDNSSEGENLNIVRLCHNINRVCEHVLHCHLVLQHPHICKLLCRNIIQPLPVLLLWYGFDISASKSYPFINVSCVVSQVILILKTKSSGPQHSPILWLSTPSFLLVDFCYILFWFSPQINKMLFL